jgi:hypothetical protein
VFGVLEAVQIDCFAFHGVVGFKFRGKFAVPGACL